MTNLAAVTSPAKFVTLGDALMFCVWLVRPAMRVVWFDTLVARALRLVPGVVTFCVCTLSNGIASDPIVEFAEMGCKLATKTVAPWTTRLAVGSTIKNGSTEKSLT